MKESNRFQNLAKYYDKKFRNRGITRIFNR